MKIKLFFNQFVYCILSQRSKILKDTCSALNIDIRGIGKKKKSLQHLSLPTRMTICMRQARLSVFGSLLSNIHKFNFQSALLLLVWVLLNEIASSY